MCGSLDTKNLHRTLDVFTLIDGFVSFVGSRKKAWCVSDHCGDKKRRLAAALQKWARAAVGAL
jgi:hypothetical protein